MGFDVADGADVRLACEGDGEAVGVKCGVGVAVKVGDEINGEASVRRGNFCCGGGAGDAGRAIGFFKWDQAWSLKGMENSGLDGTIEVAEEDGIIAQGVEEGDNIG